MMQPSLPPSPKTASSIYEAIRDCDWEGLLALYATTVYDAVHSEDIAHQQIDQHHRQYSSPSLTAGIVEGRDRSGSFHEETKSDEVHLKNYKSSSLSSSSSAVHELDLIVREIIGAEIFDEHNCDTSRPTIDDQKQVQSNNNFKKQADGRQPNNKKTRKHSPARESTNLRCLPSALDQILSHKSSPTSSSNKIPDWEKIMWNSASVLSNTAPSPSFVANRQDRNRHQSRCDSTKNKNSNGSKEGDGPIFQGSVAIATPGDLADGGTGSGTSQHLACLLDSPFALCILIVLGIRVDSRYTTFRRLAIHEAAASDSPQCLQLLMELSARFSPSFNTTTAVLSGGTEISSATMTTSQQKRSSTNGKKKKKKLNNMFTGKWHKGKSLEGYGDSTLKNSLADDCKTSNNKASSFPQVALTLKVLWDAVQKLGSGDIENEMEAANYVLDRVKVSDRATMILASSQYSHHIPENAPQSKDKAAALSPFSGLDLMQPDHHDLRSLIMKSNVDGNGNTPLHWAAFKGSVRSMKVLLSFDVDVNARAQSGWSPLHDAAYSDSADVVALLLAAGATVNARCLSGATPLCFAAQEDAANSTRILLRAGADPSLRCLGNNPGRRTRVRANNADNNRFHSRFSGYTPLHYCAHYNASKAARVLLTESSSLVKAADLLRIPDVNGQIPIHVAVARGSCLVLKELLHGGARIKTSSRHSPPSFPRAMVLAAQLSLPSTSPSVAIPTATDEDGTANEDANELSTSPIITTPVSSPVLRAMIPSKPVTSSKKWNCLTQRAIDDCKNLINQADMNWTPERHSLFSPTDRTAIVEVLRVGKRLESVGRGFIDLWPHVLAFCGRGWFEVEEDDVTTRTGASSNEMDRKIPAKKGHATHEEEISDDSSDESSSSSSDDDDDDFTQFQLDGIHTAVV